MQATQSFENALALKVCKYLLWHMQQFKMKPETEPQMIWPSSEQGIGIVLLFERASPFFY